MKRYITSALCVLTCALLLCGCSGNSFELSDDKLVNKKTDIAYHYAPACYEPISRGMEKLGEYNSLVLYEIVGADPEKWLCEEMGAVLYADGVSLPTLAEMNISSAEVLIDTVDKKTLSSETTAALISAYVSAEGTSRPSVSEKSIAHSVMLRFSDESIGICYMLSYLELKEDYTQGDTNYGKYFVFNRAENRCVAVPDLLNEYLG